MLNVEMDGEVTREFWGSFCVCDPLWGVSILLETVRERCLLHMAVAPHELVREAWIKATCCVQILLGRNGGACFPQFVPQMALERSAK